MKRAFPREGKYPPLPLPACDQTPGDGYDAKLGRAALLAERGIAKCLLLWLAGLVLAWLPVTLYSWNLLDQTQPAPTLEFGYAVAIVLVLTYVLAFCLVIVPTTVAAVLAFRQWANIDYCWIRAALLPWIVNATESLALLAAWLLL